MAGEYQQFILGIDIGQMKSKNNTIARSNSRVVLMLIAALALGSCAAKPPAGDLAAIAEYKSTNDPLEPMNRAMFEFNQELDRIILKPIATIYRDKVPEPAQASVLNFMHNIDTPMNFANEVLQLKLKKAGISLSRFAINSTIGVAGLFDPASTLGLRYNNEDFGQTLGRYGVPEGPYLMIPLLGPSNPRDAFGDLVDAYFNPIGSVVPIEVRGGISVVSFVDSRSRSIDLLDELERTSLDFYAAARSALRQRRQDAVENDGEGGSESDDLDLEGFDFGDDFDDEL